jgi:hypothetical protein
LATAYGSSSEQHRRAFPYGCLDFPLVHFRDSQHHLRVLFPPPKQQAAKRCADRRHAHRQGHFAHFASAVLIAGRDDAAAKSIVARFVSELGFDSLDVGGLAQGWKFEVDSRVFGAKLNLATVKAALL